MKKVLILLLFLFNFIRAFTQNENQDAIIIFNKEEQTYNHIKLGNNFYSTEIIFKVTRRIKVLSPYGLDQFATLYIPTYQDLDFKAELIELKAQTIKQTGLQNSISKDAIKETTLPANVPFLKKYKGKVKAMAFENLEIGDDIQYEFQIKYTTTSNYPYLFRSIKTILPEEYDIQEASYIYTLKNNIKFRSVVVNSTAKFIKSPSSDRDNSIYTLKMKDIKPYSNEDFSSDEDNQPYYIADIYKTDDYVLYEKWEDYTKEMKESKKSSIFFAGKSVSNLYSECRNEPTSIKKVLKLHDLMMIEIKKKPENIYSLFTNYEPDLEDANQLFRLLKLLKINGSVLLVKNKHNGSIIKDFVSLSQFDKLIIEFYDKEKTQYIDIFNPYASLNEIGADFQDTEALKMSINDNNESVSFTKVPIFNTSNNIAKYGYSVNLKNYNGKTLFNCSLHVQKKGQFFIEERIPYLMEKNDKKINFYTNQITCEIGNSYPECTVDTIIISDNINQIDYRANYDYFISLDQPDKIMSFKLSDFVNSGFLLSEYDKDRTTKAIFSYPKEIIWTFVIKAEDGFTSLPNMLLKKNFENEFAKLQTDFKIITPTTIEISIGYKIKLTVLSPEQWPLFLNFIDAAHDALSQRVLFQK